MLADIRPIFRAIAITVVPEAARLAPAGWADHEGIVERALAGHRGYAAPGSFP